MYALRVPGRPPRPPAEASILDITPSLLDLLGLPADPDLSGRSLLAEREVLLP
jgi:arylsulfatase A-like enzyme